MDSKRVKQRRCSAWGLMVTGLAAGLSACVDRETAAESEEDVQTVSSGHALEASEIENSLSPDLTEPGDIYMTSFSETIDGSGSLPHAVYLYQPNTTGERVHLVMYATDDGGAVDATSEFNQVRWVQYDGASARTETSLPDSTGVTSYTSDTTRKGWYIFKFVMETPEVNRTLHFYAYDEQGRALKIMWVAPPGTSVAVSADVQADSEGNAFFKGATFSSDADTPIAYADEVTVDGRLLYRRGFNQGAFNYPVGSLSTGSYDVSFTLNAASGSLAQSWFGIDNAGFDPSGSKTAWDSVQILYQGAMHTADYDAWSEGVAFAQGSSRSVDVRPPPVRRGTTFVVVCDDDTLGAENADAELQIFFDGDEQPLDWARTLPAEHDYTGGVYAGTQFVAHHREHWQVTVPSDAPIGRYIIRAVAPNGAPIGSDVMFYVIHDPYRLVQAAYGLTRAELESFGYDEDEDGLNWNEAGRALLPAETDDDAQRDNFTATVRSEGSNGWSSRVVYTGAFRRTDDRDGVDYSILDYAMAAAHGATSEMETMLHLLRFVNKRLRYVFASTGTRLAPSLLGTLSYPESALEAAENSAIPGYDTSVDFIGSTGVCYDYADALAAIARSIGLVARPATGDVGGWGSHAITEAFIPNLPQHGGRDANNPGAAAADTDPWYIFDATDHPSSPTNYTAATPPAGSPPDWEPTFAFEFFKHPESISPRGQYYTAGLLLGNLSGTPGNDRLMTTAVEWTVPDMTVSNWTVLPTGETVDLIEDYGDNAAFWITEDGVTGWLGSADKDVYKIDSATVQAEGVRVEILPSIGGTTLDPKLCIVPASASPGVLGERCADAASARAIPEGESYLVVFNDSENLAGLHGDFVKYRIDLLDEIPCTFDSQCPSGQYCSDGVCTPKSGCDAGTAVDLGVTGTPMTVSNDGCVKVDAGYPGWWGTRPLNLMNLAGGRYPVPFTWTNSCSGGAGDGVITGDWQSQILSPTSNACATVIDLQGDGSGDITIQYYAN